MADKKSPKRDDDEQSRDFIKTAREHGADRESKADDVIERLAKRPPDPRTNQKG